MDASGLRPTMCSRYCTTTNKQGQVKQDPYKKRAKFWIRPGEICRAYPAPIHHRHFSTDGSDVGDPSLVASLHVGQNEKRGVDGSPEHDVHCLLEILRGLRLQRPYRNYACIVNQHVDFSVMGNHLVDHLLDFVALSDVAAKRQNLCIHILQDALGVGERLLISAADCELASLLGALFRQS